MKKYSISTGFFICFFVCTTALAQTNASPKEITVLRTANPDYKEQKAAPSQTPSTMKVQNPGDRNEKQDDQKNNNTVITELRAKKPE